MKLTRLGLGAVLLATLTVGGCLIVSLALRSLDPFPILEFVDNSGPAASRRMYSWKFSVDPSAVRRISMKSTSSIDSYSTWTKFELASPDAEHNRCRASRPDGVHFRLPSTYEGV